MSCVSKLVLDKVLIKFIECCVTKYCETVLNYQIISFNSRTTLGRSFENPAISRIQL